MNDILSEQSGCVLANDLAMFLSRYCARLLGAGATCIRMEKNVNRIAHAFGMHAELTIMPRHIHISLWSDGCSDVVTSIATVRHNVISYNVNTLLSQLSWEIADRKLTFEEAKEKFERVVTGDRQSQLLVLILVTFANASFCRLFGGDLIAMVIVAFATFIGYWLKQLLISSGCDVRLMVVICSFVSGVLGATDILFNYGTTPDIALGTSVLYLVPGIPFLNSFSDLLNRHYLCAFSRFADALVLTGCLSIGLGTAMIMMNTGMF